MNQSHWMNQSPRAHPLKIIYVVLCVFWGVLLNRRQWYYVHGAMEPILHRNLVRCQSADQHCTVKPAFSFNINLRTRLKTTSLVRPENLLSCLFTQPVHILSTAVADGRVYRSGSDAIHKGGHIRLRVLCWTDVFHETTASATPRHTSGYPSQHTSFKREGFRDAFWRH